jgi:hypothetical protein
MDEFCTAYGIIGMFFSIMVSFNKRTIIYIVTQDK